MDFDDILPILSIAIYIIGVIFKKENKDKKKNKISKNKNKISTGKIAYIEKFKEKVEILKKEKLLALENSKADDHESERKRYSEGEINYGNKQSNIKEVKDQVISKDFKEIKETKIKEEMKDRIYENEIGNEGISINKRSVLNGIIMSEILGKPKALKR